MKFLINRTDAIGDTILTLPLAKVIKQCFPGSNITFLVSPLVSPLVHLDRHVDHVWQWDKKSWTFNKIIQLYFQIKQEHFDVYIHVGGDSKISWLGLFGHIPIRLGLRSKLSSFLCLNRGVRQQRSQTGLHEIDLNIQLLRPLIGQFPVKDLYPKLIAKDSSRIDDLLKSHSVNRYIVIHPGMTGHSLNWPLPLYLDLIEKLLKSDFMLPYTLILSYSNYDLNYLGDFLDQLKALKVDDRCLYYNGSEFGLTHSLYLYSKASAYIGPSTGPTHMAASVNTPLISFYSPIKAQKASRWKPVAESASVIVNTPQVNCPAQNKCHGASCISFECMGKIGVKGVISQLQSLIQKEN